MNMGRIDIRGRTNVRHSVQSARNNHLFRAAPVARGKGRAYHLVLPAVEPSKPGTLWEKTKHENLDEALDILRGVVSSRKISDYASLISSLHAEYNIDDIIQFSHAWQCWEALPDVLRGLKSFETLRLGQILPLDQQLFRGTHQESRAYQDGIERLANYHAANVEMWLRPFLPSNRTRTLLDLGAGPGVYARLLVDSQIAIKATCVDFEPAVRRGQITASKCIEWIAQDLFELSLAEDASYDVVYIGNVFHHYSLDDNVRYLNRIANNLSPGAVIIVQDYLLAKEPRHSPLYAAILGVHFALTSTAGRCYTRDEISMVIGEALPKAAFQSQHHLDSSDLLLYRCD